MADNKNPYEDNSDETTSEAGRPTATSTGKTMEEDISQTDKGFNDFCKTLEEEIKDAESKENEAENGFESNKETRRIKTLDLIWARRTHQEYGMFCNSISTIMSQSAVEINTNITNLKTLNGDLSKKMTTAIEAIKNAKDKLATVDTLACALGEGIKDSCNSQQVKIIREGLKSQNGSGDQDALKTCVDDVIACADETHDMGDNTFEAAVKVSGINAFTNLDSLTEFGTSAETKITAFHEDVVANMTYAAGKISTVQEELKTTLTELTQSQFLTFNTISTVKGLEATKDFAQKKTLPDDPEEQDLQSICLEVEKTFNQTIDEMESVTYS